ncbi:hypothetical protein [Vitiosangium sp. GDMCC 1.1324]|uniref:hypothetical protein n=1 Tax=Vitiosangium sp. (strain GDMCC 1.1324) TaxID=2138576 RepID=UPI000D3BE3B3|nr:hypothetical protein [Vitiosangium sp. GDMCC 1.1324]PTL75365.1 hypothetical protein DAT35_55345 [Vitiosangium sp. GDMCC 1.1324]
MRKLLWVLFAAGVLSGCKKEEAPAPAREDTGMAASKGEQGASGEAVEDFDDSKPYVLTQAKLDAFVGYQRKVLDAYAAMAKELQAAKARLLAGSETPGKGPSLSESMKAIESKAEAEARARREAGLTEEDVNRIGALVTDVITQRHMAAMLDLAGELKKLEEMQAKLKPEQAKELAPQIELMRQRVQETEKLVSVRKLHGDANVDLVLTREKDLMTNYQDMLRSFGAKAQ